jgi:phage-related protein
MVAAITAVASVIVFLKRNWEEVTQAVKDFADNNIVPILEDIKESFEKLKGTLSNLAQAFIDAIPLEVRLVLFMIGQEIGEVVTAIGEWFASIEWLEAIGKVFEVVGGIIFGIVSGVIAGAVQTLLSFIEGIVQAITGFVEITSGIIQGIIGILTGDGELVHQAAQDIIDGIVDLFVGLYDATINPIIEFVKGVISWFVELWDELVGHSVVPDMMDDIVQCFKDLPGRIWTWLTELVNGVISRFTKMWNDVVGGIKGKLTEAKNTITGIWGEIKTYFANNIAPKFTKQYWLNKFENLKSAASEKLNAVKSTIQNTWGNVKSWFNTNVSSKFTKSYWTDKFNSIKNGAKSAFNGVIEIVESAINKIINKINTLSWKIPDWVPAVGGSKFGFNFKTVSIPRLATGGITTRSTIANIGENGREAVLPLENNTGWMDMLADRLASRIGGDTKVVLQVGEKELGWATINSINGITKQTGGLQLHLV